LDSIIKAGQSTEEGEEDESEEGEECLSDSELKALKKKLSAAKKRLKRTRASFVERLEQAQMELPDKKVRELVLEILSTDLRQELDRYVAAHRQEIVSLVETWWDKYRVTLRDIENNRNEARTRLDGFLEELGVA